MTEPVIEDTESSADKEDRKRIVKNLKETMGRSVKIEKDGYVSSFQINLKRQMILQHSKYPWI